MAGGAGESPAPKLDTVAQVDRQALVGFGAFPPRPTGGRRSLASEMRRQPLRLPPAVRRSEGNRGRTWINVDALRRTELDIILSG